MKVSDKTIIDWAKLGNRGGLATKKKYGSEHFAELARKRWETVKSKKQSRP